MKPPQAEGHSQNDRYECGGAKVQEQVHQAQVIDELLESFKLIDSLLGPGILLRTQIFALWTVNIYSTIIGTRAINKICCRFTESAVSGEIEKSWVGNMQCLKDF